MPFLRRLADVEHLLVLLIELGRWIDRRFQKTLKRAIPELDHLLRDPHGTLAAGPIAIGPVKKYGSAIFVSIVVALITWVLGFLVILLTTDWHRLPAKQQSTWLVVWLIGLAVVFFIALRVVLYAMRGGQATLMATGVEFAYRGTVVACPWALFNAAGQPFLPRQDRMLLPIAPRALPFVEQRSDEVVQATGERINTRQLKFRSGTEAVLRPLYEVNLAELGGLLLRLGRPLGTKLPEGMVVPLDEAVREALVPLPEPPDRNGWITIRLTQLVFPPFCCDCGASTEQVQEFHGHAALLRLGRFFNLESGEFARFLVPVCPDCQKENNARFRLAVFKGVAIGLAIPLLISVALALIAREINVLWMFLPLGMVGGLIALAVGRTIGKDRSQPVKLERYSSSKGTVAIRFRWRAYGERLLAFLDAQDELRGDGLPGRVGVANPG
jgi:hypothetical protein